MDGRNGAQAAHSSKFLLQRLSLIFHSHTWLENEQNRKHLILLGERAKKKKKKLHLQNVVCQVWEEKSDPEPKNASCKDKRSSPEKVWPGSAEPPALHLSLKRSLFSKMIYCHVNSFLGWNVLFNVRSTWDPIIIIIIIIAGQQIVLNTKLSFLSQLGRKCNPLKLPVLDNRCHFLHIFTFRNLYTLGYINRKNAKWPAVIMKYVKKKKIVKKLKIKALKIIYKFIFVF